MFTLELYLIIKAIRLFKVTWYVQHTVATYRSDMCAVHGRPSVNIQLYTWCRSIKNICGNLHKSLSAPWLWNNTHTVATSVFDSTDLYNHLLSPVILYLELVPQVSLYKFPFKVYTHILTVSHMVYMYVILVL